MIGNIQPGTARISDDLRDLRPVPAKLARRLAALETISRQRRLTADETTELAALEFDRRRRTHRLPLQIAAAEAKLLRLRAELALLAR